MEKKDFETLKSVVAQYETMECTKRILEEALAGMSDSQLWVNGECIQSTMLAPSAFETLKFQLEAAYAQTIAEIERALKAL